MVALHGYRGSFVMKTNRLAEGITKRWGTTLS